MFAITNEAAFDIWINADIKILIAVFTTVCESYMCVILA